jgi:hypothetical protein
VHFYRVRWRDGKAAMGGNQSWLMAFKPLIAEGVRRGIKEVD